MSLSVAQKLIRSHLVEGGLTPGSEIGIRTDQTLTENATGTLVMLELEATGLDRVRTELSVRYVDHNLIQADFRNPDDHLFLRRACRAQEMSRRQIEQGLAGGIIPLTQREGRP